MFTIIATSKGQKFRFDQAGDGEWSQYPVEEKTFSTLEEAQNFLEKGSPIYDAELFQGWDSIEVVEI